MAVVKKDDGNILTRLQKEIKSLNALIRRKEEEWKNLVQLKKLKETALECLTMQQSFLRWDRTKEVALANYINCLTGSVELQQETFTEGTDLSFERIRNLQNEIKNSKFTYGSSSEESDATIVMGLDNMKASQALRLLSEKGKPQPCNSNHRVIGAGRQGPIVDVRSIIESFQQR